MMPMPELINLNGHPVAVDADGVYIIDNHDDVGYYQLSTENFPNCNYPNNATWEWEFRVNKIKINKARH